MSALPLCPSITARWRGVFPESKRGTLGELSALEMINEQSKILPGDQIIPIAGCIWTNYLKTRSMLETYRARLSERCCGSWWERRASARLPWTRTRELGTRSHHLLEWSGSCYYHWRSCRSMMNCRWCCLHWAAVAAAAPRISEKPCWIWNCYWCCWE